MRQRKAEWEKKKPPKKSTSFWYNENMGDMPINSVKMALKAGMSYRQIQEKYHVSPNTIAEVKKAMNLHIKPSEKRALQIAIVESIPSKREKSLESRVDQVDFALTHQPRSKREISKLRREKELLETKLDALHRIQSVLHQKKMKKSGKT